MSDFDFTYNDDPENPYTSVDNSHNSESDNDDHVEDRVADESHNSDDETNVTEHSEKEESSEEKKTRRLSVDLPADLVDTISRLSPALDISRAEFIEGVLREAVDKEIQRIKEELAKG